jgi:hypothetical protein
MRLSNSKPKLHILDPLTRATYFLLGADILSQVSYIYTLRHCNYRFASIQSVAPDWIRALIGKLKLV